MPPRDKVNLLPKDEFEFSSTGKLIGWAVSVGRWIVVFTEFIVICAFLSRFYFDTQLANLFDDIKQKKAIVASAAAFEENFRQTQEKIKIIKKLLNNQQSPSALVGEISQMLPADVSLLQISIDEGEVTLSGLTLSEKGLRVFLNQLVKSPHFSQISLNNITQPKDGLPGLTFTVSASINNKIK